MMSTGGRDILVKRRRYTHIDGYSISVTLAYHLRVCGELPRDTRVCLVGPIEYGHSCIYYVIRTQKMTKKGALLYDAIIAMCGNTRCITAGKSSNLCSEELKTGLTTFSSMVE